MKEYFANLEEDTVANSAFRTVVFTGSYLQLVLMRLQPGDDIGDEVHEDTDQFFRVEAGEARIIVNGIEHDVHTGMAVIVPAGSKHNVINDSATDVLSLYTIYAPPNHPDGYVQQLKKLLN